jgi:tetratricopeptide (TPR) repeat protein
VSRRSKKPRPEEPISAPSVPKSRSRTIAVIVAVVLIVTAGLFLTTQWQLREGLARLPSPPTLASQQKVIEDHLRVRYEAARAAPTSIVAVGPLCLAYHADMFFDQADRCYQLALTLAPDDWRWTYYRSVIQSERGGGQALVTNLHRVLERAPQFGPAWLRLGEAQFKAGRYDEAVMAWQQARDLPPPEESRTSPGHVIEIPLSAYATLGLARVALVRGEFDEARKTLEQLSAAAPNFGSALRLLAESYSRLGRESDAARLVYRAGRLPPYSAYADPVIDELARESRNSIFLLRVASEANLAVNAEWSEYLTRRALEFDSNNPEVVLKLARMLRTVERNGEALELFQRYQVMVPGDYQVLAHLGSCLSAMGRFGEAEAYFRKALNGLDDPVTHFNLGLLLALTGRLDGAVMEYEKALERDPMHSDARTNLAATLVRQGKLERAENATARTNLGLVLLQQGRLADARGQFEEALRLEPGLTPARQALDAMRHQ